jgi:serine/threonine protein kinase
MINSTTGHVKGTYEFMPPEILNAQGSDPSKQDVWAIGVMAYQMCE